MAPVTDELMLDNVFWTYVSTDERFRAWFFAQTKFGGRQLQLVSDEKWHQRWYRDPETGKDLETDILLMLVDMSTNERCALHIENKPAHRTWEPDQAVNYRKRAIDRMNAWRHQEFQTVLLAPSAFISRWPIEVGHFDVVVSYEDIGVFIPEFARAAV